MIQHLNYEQGVHDPIIFVESHKESCQTEIIKRLKSQ